MDLDDLYQKDKDSYKIGNIYELDYERPITKNILPVSSKNILSLVRLSKIDIDPADELYTALKKVQPISGYEDFANHGDPEEIEHRNSNDEPIILTAEEYANALKSNPELDYHGGNIRLIACQCGAKENGFAQQLADILNVDVMAATEAVTVNDEGELFVTDDRELSNRWYSGERGPDIVETGKWLVFSPRKGEKS